STFSAGAIRPLISAMPPKATELMRHNETSRCANSGHQCHRACRHPNVRMPASFPRDASVARVGPGVLNGLFVITRFLRRPRLDHQLAELAGKTERRLVIFVIHARARINSDVKRLINRKERGDRVRDRLAGDFLAVNGQDAGAALRLAWAVIFEIKYDC